MKKLFVIPFALSLLAGSTALAGGEGEKPKPQCPGETKVFVAYADNDLLQHPGPAFLPSPWSGSPGVTFIGTPGPNGEFDAGAIRIDNPSTSPLTIDSITVDIGTSLGIDPWAVGVFPVVVPGGGTAIFTENKGLFDFDTSDFPTSQCIPDGFIPVVHITLGTSNQVVRDFSDTTQVLNTGGFDLADCPTPGHGKNEGQQWVKVKQNTECECDRDEGDRDDGDRDDKEADR